MGEPAKTSTTITMGTPGVSWRVRRQWSGAHEEGRVDVRQLAPLAPLVLPVRQVRLRGGADHKEERPEEEERADPERDALHGRAQGVPDAVAVKDGERVQVRLVLDLLPLRPVAPVLPCLPRVAPARRPVRSVAMHAEMHRLSDTRPCIVSAECTRPRCKLQGQLRPAEIPNSKMLDLNTLGLVRQN